MWSLGCVIAELFLGWPLYPGASEYDQVGPGSSGVHKRHFLCNVIHGWGLGCFLVSQTLLSVAVLFFLYSSFLPPFLLLLLSFSRKSSLFSKALEP